MIEHLFWSTMAALAAVAVAFALRRRNAVLRHAILLAALVRFALPTAWLTRAGGALAGYLPAPASPAFGDFPWLLMTPGATAPMPMGAAAAPGMTNFFWLLWAAGFAISIAVWLRGLWRAAPVLRAANAAEESAFLQAMGTLEVTIPVGLRVAPACQTPAARGWWRPCVVLPDGLSAQLSDAELASVLVHELAHVRRRDNLWAAVARAIVSVFWFHPLLWWIERRMLAERERACDELVLDHGARAEDYVSGILKVCRMAFTGAAGYAGATGSNLKQRMEQIMSAKMMRPSSRTLRAALGVLLAAAVLVPAAGGFLRAQAPADIPAFVKQGSAQVSRGAYGAALESAEAALQKDKTSEAARLLKAAALIGLKRYSEARTVLQDLLQANPRSADALFQVGALELAEGRYAEAEEVYRRVRQLEPQNARGLMGVVEVYMKQNRGAEAVALLRDEVAKNPGRTDYRIALANAAVRTGQYDLAIAEFQRALDGTESGGRAAGDIYLRMGETYRRKGDLNAAIGALEQARSLLPDNPKAITTLALTLESAGRNPEAKLAYEEALRVDPRNGVALNNLAYLQSENGGDLDQALKHARMAAELLPNLAEVRDTMGWVYLKRRQTEEAIAEFRAAIHTNYQHASFHLHLAMALDQRGDQAGARQELQEAMRAKPTAGEARTIAEWMERIGKPAN